MAVVPWQRAPGGSMSTGLEPAGSGGTGSSGAGGTGVATPPGLRRTVVASVIGTIAEYYDFFIYGTASALVFNTVFFPEVDPLVGTLAAFSTYAVGFLA